MHYCPALCFFLFLPTNLRLVMLTLCRLSRAKCFLFVKRNGKNCWWKLDHPPAGRGLALSELPVIDEKSDLEVMLNIISQGKCQPTVCICCKKGQYHIRNNKKSIENKRCQYHMPLHKSMVWITSDILCAVQVTMPQKEYNGAMEGSEEGNSHD